MRVEWQVSNLVDGLLVDFHGELRWVHLDFFGTDETNSCVCQLVR
jgi:hypothetical protein